MLVINVEADSPYGEGYRLGLQAGSLVSENTMRLKRLISLGVVRVDLSGMEKWMGRIPGRIMEELRGLADGSGVGLRDLVLLNYAGESLFGEECTAAVIAPNLTQTHTPIIWKNRDMGARWMQHQILLLEKGGDGRYGFIAVTTAGHWGVAMGINEKGLAVENTFVFAGRYVNPKPEWGNLWLIRMLLEEAGSIDEAYRMISSIRGKYSGSSFLLADQNGAAVVDVVGDELHIITRAKDFIVRTNHWEPVAPRELWSYEVNKSPEESVKRYEAAYSFLSQRAEEGGISVKDMITLARNTANGPTPYSPCRFPRRPEAPKEAVDESATLSAAIMIPYSRNPELSVMWTAMGNPLLAPFTPILVAARRYDERSVELENARRFAEKAPSLQKLPPREIMAKLREISEPWLASITSSGEAWLASERLRELLYRENTSGVGEARATLLSAWRMIEDAFEDKLLQAVFDHGSPVEAARTISEVLEEAEGKLEENLSKHGAVGVEAAVNAERILLSLYASLKADAWGLWKLTGSSGWEEAGRIILEAFHKARGRAAGLAEKLQTSA